jgi:hypothetical protein
MTDRDLLEKRAIEEVCACQYYDLTDNIEAETDATLTGIVDHTIPCDTCNQ